MNTTPAIWMIIINKHLCSHKYQTNNITSNQCWQNRSLQPFSSHACSRDWLEVLDGMSTFPDKLSIQVLHAMITESQSCTDTYKHTHTQTQTHRYCTCLPLSKVNRGCLFTPVCLLICEQDISKVGRIWTKPGEWVGLRDVFIAWRKQEKRRNCLELQEQLFKSKTQAASNPSLHIGVMTSCHHPHSTWPYKYNAARHLVPLSPKQNMLLLSYNEITARWELT